MNRVASIPANDFFRLREEVRKLARARAAVAIQYAGDPDTAHFIDLPREAWEQDTAGLDGLDKLDGLELSELRYIYRAAYIGAIDEA